MRFFLSFHSAFAFEWTNNITQGAWGALQGKFMRMYAKCGSWMKRVGGKKMGYKGNESFFLLNFIHFYWLLYFLCVCVLGLNDICNLPKVRSTYLQNNRVRLSMRACVYSSATSHTRWLICCCCCFFGEKNLKNVLSCLKAIKYIFHKIK